MANRFKYPKRIPRERAIAALELAGRLLDHEETLLVEEQPDGFNAGMSPEKDATTVEPDTWCEWVELARKAVSK